MKKSLLKILACAAVVAMVASCQQKQQGESQNTNPSSDSSDSEQQIEYRTVSMSQINAVESDGSYSLEGEYVQFSGAAVSGGYSNVVYVNRMDVEYYSDLCGLEVHQKVAGEFEYKDVVNVKGKVVSEDGRVFLDEAEVELAENGKGAGSVYTWSTYFNRMQFQEQFNKTYSGFPIFGINLQLASLPDLERLANGQETSFNVAFPGEDLDLEDLDNTCPIFVKIPGALSQKQISTLSGYFEAAQVEDVIALDFHLFYSQSQGGLGLILDDSWTTIGDGDAVVMHEWADVMELSAEGLDIAVPDIGIDDNEKLISYVPDDSYFHADINDFGAWQIAKIASADKKNFGAFETMVNVKTSGFDAALEALVAKADALGGNWAKDAGNTDAAKKQYAYTLTTDTHVDAVLTLEQSSDSAICVDFFAPAKPWTALSIITAIDNEMSAGKVSVKHDAAKFGKITSTYGGYYYSYDTIIDTLASQVLPEGAKQTVKPFDNSEEFGYNGYYSEYTFEGFTIVVDSKEIPGQSRPAAYIYFSIYEDTNIRNADQAVVKVGYEERVNAFFGTDNFVSALPEVGNVAEVVLDYYYESYYSPLFELKGQFTDYELTFFLEEELPEGVTAATIAADLKTALAGAGFVEKLYNTTNKAGLFNETTREFVMVDEADAEDTEIFVEIYNLSEKAVETGLKVTAEFDNFADAKAEYVAKANDKAERLTGEAFGFESALPALDGAVKYVTNWGSQDDYDDYYEAHGLILKYSITATFGDSDNVEAIFTEYLTALNTAGFVLKEFNQQICLFNAEANELLVPDYDTETKTISLNLTVFNADSAKLVTDIKQFAPADVAAYLIPILNGAAESEPVSNTTDENGVVTVVWNDSVDYFGWYVNSVLMSGNLPYGTWTRLGYDYDGDGTFANMTYFYIAYQSFEGTQIVIRVDKVDDATMTLTVTATPAE